MQGDLAQIRMFFRSLEQNCRDQRIQRSLFGAELAHELYGQDTLLEAVILKTPEGHSGM